MLVRRLSLANFRNYTNAELELHAGPNLLVGSNGQGKTNLVEAIAYFATLGSHRVSQDSAMIRQGEASAVVRTLVAHGERELVLEVELNRSTANRAQVNRTPTKPRELPRYLQTVVFAPEDLALVRGEPSGRRRMMDELLIQLIPRLAGVTADYDRVLRQRNTLLKSARSSGLKESQLTTLDIWDERLVALGSELIDARNHLIEELSPHVAEAYAQIVGSDHEPTMSALLSIDGAGEDDDLDAPVETDEATEQRFRRALAITRRRELERGISLVGPHRDDVFLSLNDLPVRGYASHGESWSFALALRLGAAQLLRERSPLGDPVLVLDDVFAELDENRRARLAQAVAGFEQVIITAAVLGDVPSALATRTVRIHAGQIMEDLDG